MRMLQGVPTLVCRYGGSHDAVAVVHAFTEIDGLVQEAMAGRISCQEMLDEWAAIMTELYAEEG